jgi:heparanase
MGPLLMSKEMSLASYAAVALVGLGSSVGSAAAESVQPTLLTPAVMPPIAKIDERFLSYNVEMAEVIGGNFWKPYTPATIAALKTQASSPPRSGSETPAVAGHDSTMFQARPPIDLSNARLRKLASAFAPAYMRTSGTWANSIYFHDSDSSPPPTPPDGFQGLLTRSEWKSVIDFSRSVGAKLVTSFAISAGVRDASGIWTPNQARKFVTYTNQAGGSIAAAEFFNEPNIAAYGGAPNDYKATDYARDFAIFHRFARANAPDMAVVGPGSVGEGVLQPLMSGPATAGFSSNDMLSANPTPKYDVFSYHFYGAVSLRCISMGGSAQTTPEAALSEAWLARADTSYDFYVRGLRDRYEQGKLVWITETADSACGGNPWASTFLDSFRFLDQLARIARQGVSVVFHNTLASSEYGLLDQNAFTPRPNYWAALLWRKLMGSTVLDAGPLQPGLHIYAHCLRGHAGGVTLLAINLSRTKTKIIDLPMAADIYALTAPELQKGEVQLNGQELQLGSDDELPDLSGKHFSAGRIDLKPASINFLVVHSAENSACK